MQRLPNEPLLHRKIDLIGTVWPISKYVGFYPEGAWEFVEEFPGTQQEAYEHANALQKLDPDKEYRIWDCR